MLPLSILAPAIPGYTMMICRLTGTIVAADCGGAAMQDAPASPTPPGPGWQAASCCDTLRVTFDRAPAETHAEAPALATRPIPTGWSMPVVVERMGTRDTRALAPPGLGPPRRLITQTFLI